MRPEFPAGARVGVYGGSFDPIHVGHIEPAMAALEVARLDQVVLLPTAFPPHKDGVRQADAPLRLEMAQLAVAEIEGLLVLDDEITDERVFTVDTLRALSVESPLVEFVLIIGADSYQDLAKWKEWEAIVAGWDIAVLARPGWSLEQEALPRAVQAVLTQHPERQHLLLTEPNCDISSTEIRRRLAAGEPVPPEWVSAPVLSFIETHALYGPAAVQTASCGTAAVQTTSESTLNTTPAAADRTDTESVRKEEAKPTLAPLPPEVALAARTALDKQAVDLRVLQVGEVCGFADYFIVCSGNSDRQVDAISKGIQRALRDVGERALHVEGERRGNWILVDYGHLIVHVFDPQTRDFYRLERLWDDAPRVPRSLYAEEPPRPDAPTGGAANPDAANPDAANLDEASLDNGAESGAAPQAQ